MSMTATQKIFANHSDNKVMTATQTTSTKHFDNKGMTATQKIFANHSNRDFVIAGELISASVDLILGNDITAPVAIAEMKKVGNKVFDNDKIILVLDHFVPCKDIQSAELCKTVRNFAKEQGISHIYDLGEMGIEHALLPELGLIRPSMLAIGADSHTCTYGALGCFSTGIGSTDMAAAMLTGKTWFRVPSAIKIILKGSMPKYVTGKDLILTLIGILGVDGATYKSLEFFGDLQSLSIDDRLTICNMAIECGAKNAFMPLDDISIKYLIERDAIAKDDVESLTILADDDAEYEREIVLDLDKLSPTVAFPSLPDNVRHFAVDCNGQHKLVKNNIQTQLANDYTGQTQLAKNCVGQDEIAEEIAEEIAIDQVVIGSCTNGRISDMRQAAEILKGKKVAKGVRCIVIPASMEVYKQCLTEGLTEIFVSAGAVVSTPTCGPCLGGFMGILASDEVCVSTTNRNFVGRMGHPSSKVYLASPYIAAASAIAGRLSAPSGLEVL